MTISETLFSSGLCPTRVDQAINVNSQVATVIATYLDGSKVYGAYTYTDSLAVEYLISTYGLTAQSTSTAPVPAYVSAATAYSVTLGNMFIGLTSNIAANTVTGFFPTGTVITPIVTGVTGTFNPATLTPTTGSTSVLFTFTPTSSGVAVFSFTNNVAMSNPTPISRTASLTVTWQTMLLGATNTNGVLTIPNTSHAGGVGLLPADFTEMRLSCDEGISLSDLTLAINATSDFSQVYANSGASFNMRFSINSGVVVTGSGKVDSQGFPISYFNGKTLPVNSVVSFLRYGTDLLVRYTLDSVTYTLLGTIPAFVGVALGQQMFISITKPDDTSGNGVVGSGGVATVNLNIKI